MTGDQQNGCKQKQYVVVHKADVGSDGEERLNIQTNMFITMENKYHEPNNRIKIADIQMRRHRAVKDKVTADDVLMIVLVIYKDLLKLLTPTYILKLIRQSTKRQK